MLTREKTDLLTTKPPTHVGSIPSLRFLALPKPELHGSFPSNLTVGKTLPLNPLHGFTLTQPVLTIQYGIAYRLPTPFFSNGVA